MSASKEVDFEWEVRDQEIPYKTHMIAGCLAGMIEHSTMFPFDNIKTHSQVIKDLSFRQIVRQLYSEGGFPAFYRGIGLVACGSMPAHAAFFSAYEFARHQFGINDEEHHPYLFAVTGAVATFLHDLIMTPIDVIKQRKQISNLPVRQLVGDMIKVEGYGSLLRSFPVTYMMNVPVSAILVSANETLKVQTQKAIEHNFFSYFMCAGIAGAISATLTTPFDVIKTKLQTQDLYQQYCDTCDKNPGKKNGSQTINVKDLPKNCPVQPSFSCKQAKYVNFLQTFQLILKEEGIRGLFRGFGSRIIIISPSSAISWASYETIKSYFLGSKKRLH